jgi:nitrogen regulatory protein P-II 1
MNSMIWFVLHDASLLADVLAAWKDAGVLGITLLPSTGLRRLEDTNTLRDDIPLIPSIEDLVSDEETLNRTLFTIVDNDAMVEKVVKVTQKIVGDLNLPNTGILCVIPLGKVYGLNRKPAVEE